MENDEYIEDGRYSLPRRDINGNKFVPGVNVDKICIKSGMEMLVKLGYTGYETAYVINYALARWARGEEREAQRGAIDQSFHGVTLTSWYMILAAAMAGVQNED